MYLKSFFFIFKIKWSNSELILPKILTIDNMEINYQDLHIIFTILFLKDLEKIHSWKCVFPWSYIDFLGWNFFLGISYVPNSSLENTQFKISILYYRISYFLTITILLCGTLSYLIVMWNLILFTNFVYKKKFSN
jgi:hypothetical protein